MHYLLSLADVHERGGTPPKSVAAASPLAFFIKVRIDRQPGGFLIENMNKIDI
jgi:hypothetical protein